MHVLYRKKKASASMYDPTLSDISSGDERSPGVSREGSRTNIEIPDSSSRRYNHATYTVHVHVHVHFIAQGRVN